MSFVLGMATDGFYVQQPDISPALDIELADSGELELILECDDD